MTQDQQPPRIRIDFAGAGRNRPPLDVCRVRKDGTVNTSWPSWYANDVDHAMHFVRTNRESTPHEYPLNRKYVVVDHRTGDEVARFTVRDALAAGDQS